jgi:hypothetical protein
MDLATIADVAHPWLGAPAWTFAAWLLLVGAAGRAGRDGTGLAQFVKLPADDPRARNVMHHMTFRAASPSRATPPACCCACMTCRSGEAVRRAPATAAIAMDVAGLVLLLAGGWARRAPGVRAGHRRVARTIAV